MLAWNGLKNRLLAALKFKKYLRNLKQFGILILESRWIFRLRFIAFIFVPSYVLVPLSNGLKLLILLLKYDQSDVLRSILIMWWTFNNLKHITIYTQEEQNSTFHYVCGISCVMLDRPIQDLLAIFTITSSTSKL